MITHPPCRGGQIRTDDLLVPNQARYRATLHPELNALFQLIYQTLLVDLKQACLLVGGCKDNHLFLSCNCFFNFFAERARFELAVPLPVRQFSKLVVSATHPSLQYVQRTNPISQ